MKITSPLFVTIPMKTKKDRKFILNLNNYRNTHYQILNHAKVAYLANIKPQVMLLPKLILISVSFTLYPKTKRLTDIPNVCSIHDKFFMDALVIIGKLEDDNYLHHTKSTYLFRNVDKENPRVEIQIDEVSKKQTDTSQG